ncbi:UDP-N-acetylglucosamine--undecaprenyl-phosphate N-acetylglucosaminephosphotransferase [Arsukibacterium indicum]|uniref:Undecaprenyl-phosphate alpha-N-acetylglucosaminyl 1-phosphate transferase n=1 Tax=Arsukibacterium indicum TaxID=2848612 RepID=A0ABS6MI59_9GAMM|nr:UDP-N-acetylglucosamine--undecaprenyl-phosphate N-acetylglucosaminephosphotransferase [Arsukibacterium indicum]MBV2128496.1 UDP-N-acetylglucosamine--undecaprenyl-phosphate N-acetylglucosaminephosphotransferase [Arsukibacterium indicum]
MPTTDITYSVLLAIAASLVAILLLRPLAPGLGLLDIPKGRKQHIGAVPLIGGLAIYLALLLILVNHVSSDMMLGYYLACAAVIVVLGAFDDALDLSVKLRLAVQLVVGLAMIYSLDLHISNLGNLFGFGAIELGIFGIPFTLLAVIAAINAFNMTDGIDGLAGLLSMVSFGSIAVFMLLWGQAEHALLPLVFIAALLPYLAFNLGWVKNKKIFMGDAGSMLIGLTVIWLLLISTQSETASFRPVTALWLIAVPIMDMVAIMLRRILKGQSPFIADREHLHHISLRLGLNSRESLLLITALAWVFACIGIIGEYLLVPEVAMLILFSLVFALYIGLLQNIWRIISAIRHNFANRR